MTTYIQKSTIHKVEACQYDPLFPQVIVDFIRPHTLGASINTVQPYNQKIFSIQMRPANFSHPFVDNKVMPPYSYVVISDIYGVCIVEKNLFERSFEEVEEEPIPSKPIEEKKEKVDQHFKVRFWVEDEVGMVVFSGDTYEEAEAYINNNIGHMDTLKIEKKYVRRN